MESDAKAARTIGSDEFEAEVMARVSKLLTAYRHASKPDSAELPDVLDGVRRAIHESIEDKTIVEGLDPTAAALLGPVAEIVRDMRGKISEKNIGAIVEVMLPAYDPVAAVRTKIEADNAAARVRFMETVPCYTNAQLADLVGHAAKNRSATGSRWKSDGRVFSVPFQGKEYYPAFQFQDGRPHPAIAAVLSALPDGMSPWQIAFWFVSSNPWLDGEVPSRRLTDREALVQAAKGEDEAVVG
jgi:hypothetical protein